VAEATLHQLYDLVKMAPTSVNCSPLRVVFVQSAAAKEKLKACLDAGNIDKTMSAPVTAILARDMAFYDQLPKLFPHADARSWFAGKPAAITATATRNATLQGGYFILAARALGLDCGPMSGFNNAKVDQEFLAGTGFESDFLCNLGYGDVQGMYPRSPRFDFAEACTIV
jgi:3-hydroxypropanoate dehydrogenase